MKRRSLTWFLALALGFGGGVEGVAAEGVSTVDARGVRAAVQGQLDAFAADDAARAYSFAAPAIRGMFGNAELFMAMVRSNYPVVYRHASASFGVPEPVGEEVVQTVHFTDGRGALWLAVYRLQRQSDKAWRITGCQVVESHARAA